MQKGFNSALVNEAYGMINRYEYTDASVQYA